MSLERETVSEPGDGLTTEEGVNEPATTEDEREGVGPSG